MKLYVIGDSITIHYGPYLEAYLHGIMQYDRKRKCDEPPFDRTSREPANGGDSSQVLSFVRMRRRMGGFDANIILLNCGLHDIKTDPKSRRRQVPLIQYRANLKAIVSELHDSASKLVWARTTPCDDAMHNRPGMAFHRYAADVVCYNRTADRIMDKAGVPAIDLHAFTLNLGGNLYCDHIHFRESVRQQQAAFIASWLTAFARNSISPKT